MIAAVFLIILVVIVGGIIAGVVSAGSRANPMQAFYRKYVAWDYFLNPLELSLIALKRDENAIVLGKLLDYEQYDLTTLMSVEVERNGQSVSVTNRGSQVIGGAIGGLLLGGAGLLIGGLSGSRAQRQKINEVALKVVVDHPTKPVHRVVFLQVGGAGLEANHPRLKAAIAATEKFHALLTACLRDQQTALPTTAEAVLPSTADPALPAPTLPSVVDAATAGLAIEDRIAKLWGLKEAGALSEAEFAAQKAQLLGSPGIAGAAHP